MDSRNEPSENAQSNSNGGMDNFLQRMRLDLINEIQSIQNGVRPVTGQQHREHIQHFMETHVVGSKEGSQTGGGKESNTPANVDSVESHRPEAVVVEVQAVVDLRPVSSVLQSAAFRRHLENVICRSLTNRQPSNSVNRPNSSSVSPGITQGAVVPLSSRLSDIDVEEVEDTVVPPENATESSSSISDAPSVIADLESLERAPSDQTETRSLWNDITSLQREEIVEEISELLHAHVVSSTLTGEFRTALELVAQNHLASSGTNGRAVQAFVNALPRSSVQRNDFSQLGIPTAHDNDNWDNISVASINTRSVPYTQTNTYLGREIQSLKSQMNEMKNMIKLTFDLQMDIQRAIRQEVAAAMNNMTAQGATGVSSVPPPSRPFSETHCLICLDRHTDSVLYQCGHMCVCFVCGRDLMSRGHSCPVCRAPIKDVIRAYKTNYE